MLQVRHKGMRFTQTQGIFHKGPGGQNIIYRSLGVGGGGGGGGGGARQCAI